MGRKKTYNRPSQHSIQQISAHTSPLPQSVHRPSMVNDQVMTRSISPPAFHARGASFHSTNQPATHTQVLPQKHGSIIAQGPTKRPSQQYIIGTSGTPGAPGIQPNQSTVTVTQQESHYSLTSKGKIAKYALFVFNLIFLLTGAAIMALGTWLKMDTNVAAFQMSVYADRPNEKYINLAAFTMIGFGVLIVFISFFGCCGACSENSCLLSVVTPDELSLFLDQEAMTTVKYKVAKNFQNGRYQPDNKFAKSWDVVQLLLKCCGVYNYTDYKNITGWHSNKGCFTTLTQYINENLAIILGVIGAIVVLELLGIILACCVCYSVRRHPATQTIFRQM